jgi:gas vesicle protein GvpA/GvpJ/GvpM family
VHHSTIPTTRPESGKARLRPSRRHGRPSPRRHTGRLVEADDASLLDVIDNLLHKGVVLNADVILALAEVDLVYVRLSALLCAADRVLPARR